MIDESSSSRRKGRRSPRPAEAEPKPNEVLIRVRASSLNRADLWSRSASSTAAVGGVGARIGLECSGEVEAVGSEVKDIKAGDRVMGSAPGGFAEYVVTDAGRVHRIPGNNMTYEQAACFPVALQTMHNAVVTAGRLKRGETHADAGRQRRRRPDGHADRQADGRLAGASAPRPMRSAAPRLEGLRLRRRASTPASRIGRRT